MKNTIAFVGHKEFINFKNGFYGIMEEDFRVHICTQNLPKIKFIAPNLDAGLFNIFVKSCTLFDKIRNKKGYVTPRDYENLGADLYIALLHDPSFTAYEDSVELGNFIFDLSFDYKNGRYHDIVLREWRPE